MNILMMIFLLLPENLLLMTNLKDKINL